MKQPEVLFLALVCCASWSHAQDKPAASVASFVPLDLPDTVLIEPSASRDRPWILVIDDAQCPYCMQLHLALEKARELGDPEISRATVARIPFPLPIHDQAAHIVVDALCLEARRGPRSWSAAAYLDWLMVGPWRLSPAWKAATLQDIAAPKGLFESHYDEHRVVSSRRREFQTEAARAESACGPSSCLGDKDCEALCATQAACLSACTKPTAETGSTPDLERCRADCGQKFISARYRQFARAHLDCLFEEGPTSAHGRTAAAYAWARAHQVPGTPTVYVGHPAVGFSLLGDSDDLEEFLTRLRSVLAETRARMSSPAGRKEP